MRALHATLLAYVLQAVSTAPPAVLSESAVRDLQASLRAAQPHRSSVWRDTAPYDAAGRLQAVVEIPRGERRKYEFDIAANAMRVDRVLPPSAGGYPVNYGIVPQTISYDGDPFDVLVLGPPLPSGTLVAGVVVGLMRMEDETGADPKVVISPVGRSGDPLHALTEAEKRRIARFFETYKAHEPGKFSRVPGWGTVEEGAAFVAITHAFFTTCRAATARCVISAR